MSKPDNIALFLERSPPAMPRPYIVGLIVKLIYHLPSDQTHMMGVFKKSPAPSVFRHLQKLGDAKNWIPFLSVKVSVHISYLLIKNVLPFYQTFKV